MESRIPYYSLAPEAYKLMLGLEEDIGRCSVPQPLAHLVKLRASQINGCAYCLDMHWKDLRAIGEPEHRLYSLDAWRESPWFTEKEQAALAWCEAVTKITEGHAEEGVYAKLREHFTDKEVADLTFVITTINAWNRLAISFRAEPGRYKSKLVPPAAGLGGLLFVFKWLIC